MKPTALRNYAITLAIMLSLVILFTKNGQSENVTLTQGDTQSGKEVTNEKDVEYSSHQNNKRNKRATMKNFDIEKRVKLISYEDLKKMGKLSNFSKDSPFIENLDHAMKYKDNVPNSAFIAYIKGAVSIDGDIIIDDFFGAILQVFHERLKTKDDYIALVWIDGKLALTGSLYNRRQGYDPTAFVVESDASVRNVVAGGKKLYFLEDLNVSEIFYVQENAEGGSDVSGAKNIKIETDITKFWTINGKRWEFSEGISEKEVEQIFVRKFEFLKYNEDGDIYYLEEEAFVETLLTGEKIFNSKAFLRDKTPDSAKKWNPYLSDDEEYGGLFADFEGEYLDEIPNDIVDNPKITALNLTDNKLKELPDAIIKMKNLKYLDISGNPIDSLPGDASKLHFETFLFYDATRLSLKDVVTFASKMPKLKSLCYSAKKEVPLEERIKKLDDMVNNLEGLKTEVIHNLISSIFPWKKSPSNPKLDRLKESFEYKEEEHPLTSFPEELKDIEELFLHDLRFETLHLKKPLLKLKTLSLAGSVYKLSEAPRWTDFPAIKSLDLSLNRYIATESELKIIDSLQYLPNTLISLNLDSWKAFDPHVIIEIQKIPQRISHLEKLESLSLFESQIDINSLIEVLPKLRKLKELDIEGIDLSFFQRWRLRKVLPKGCELSGVDD